MDQLGPWRQALFAPFWSIIRVMKQTDPQFKLRLDEDLKAALTASAKQNQRTLSAEIIARLQASFDKSGEREYLEKLVKETIQQAVEQLNAERGRND